MDARWASQKKCVVSFPEPKESQTATIRDLGAHLDAHREEGLDAHDALTMTALYNVLKKERRGEDLEPDEREIHEKGLVGVLKELHDDLDAAAAQAYGWDAGLLESRRLPGCSGSSTSTPSGGRGKRKAASGTCALTERE